MELDDLLDNDYKQKPALGIKKQVSDWDDEDDFFGEAQKPKQVTKGPAQAVSYHADDWGEPEAKAPKTTAYV